MGSERNLKDAEVDLRKISDQHTRNYSLQGKLQAEVEVCITMKALLCCTFMLLCRQGLHISA